MDSDLAEAISALKDALGSLGVSARFESGDRRLIDELAAKFDLPRRYVEFLLDSDPVDVESQTPSERVRLLPASELVEEQTGFALTDDGERIENPLANGWRPSWIISTGAILT